VATEDSVIDHSLRWLGLSRTPWEPVLACTWNGVSSLWTFTRAHTLTGAVLFRVILETLYFLSSLSVMPTWTRPVLAVRPLVSLLGTEWVLAAGAHLDNMKWLDPAVLIALASLAAYKWL
jgi:hypothetical protein